MHDVILTSYFTGKPDPQRGVFVEKNNPDLMRPWLESLTALGLTGIICHDEPIIAIGATPYYYPLKTTWSINDERFLCWLEILEARPEIDRVFLTDLFDVDFFANPFDLITPDHDLYVGCGSGFPRTIGVNRWLTNKMEKALGRVYHPDRITCNAGVIGGTRDNVVRLLDAMLDLFWQYEHDYGDKKPHDNINMAVFNMSVYNLFDPDRVMIGPPLTSLFKKYEPSGGFAIRHK